MATLLPYQLTVPRVGLVPTYSAPDPAGNLFTNYGGAILHIVNASASPVTATVHYNAFVRTQSIARGIANPVAVAADTVATVPANGEVLIGPFPPKDWNDIDPAIQADILAGTRMGGQYDDTCLVTLSAVSGVTIAAIQLLLAIRVYPTP